MTRRVVTLTLPDGTTLRRLIKVCPPDQRRPDYANRLHTGHARVACVVCGNGSQGRCAHR
jgi:hypothetical protein